MNTPGNNGYRFLLTAVCLVAWCHAGTPGIQAVEPEGEVVRSLEITGNRTVGDTVIRHKLETRINAPYREEIVREDIARLYETGYFTTISVETDAVEGGIGVTIVVEEKPEITRITIDGNRTFKTSRLIRLMRSRAGGTCNEKTLLEDAMALREYYRERGWPRAEVEYEVEPGDEAGRCVVEIEIDEGPRQLISDISFSGNEEVSGRLLSRLMRTKEKAIWPLSAWPLRLVFPRGIFDEAQFAEDIERLEEYYRSRGYIDVKVGEAQVREVKGGRYIHILIPVEEGKRYKVGEIAFAGNEVFSETEFRELLRMRTGDLFTPLKLHDDLMAMRERYFSKGYADVEIIPQKKYNPDTDRLDIAYTINEYHPYYVGRIAIEGNTRTRDRVIRRELTLEPGDLFDELKLQRSRERLENTGFFSAVNVSTEPGEEEGVREISIEVEEGKTGQLSFGGGYSTIDSFIGFAEIAQSNFDISNFPYFTGGGQKMRLRAEVGDKRQDVFLSFTEPYFLGQRLAAGFDLYSENSQYLSDYFDEERLGGTIRLGTALGAFSRADLAYRLERVTIDVDSDASAELREEDGSITISAFSLDLSRDTRDSIVLPRRGGVTGVMLECAGLGGDAEFVKAEARASSYVVPVARFPDHVVRFAGTAGVAEALGSGDELPISERFFLGGADTVRGFEYRDVGPRDSRNSPIGGEASIMGSVEYTFPLVSRIRGAAFFDMGNVYADSGDFLEEIVAAAGLGVRLQLPIGPIKLDYGIPVITDEWTEGENGAFNFTVGTAF